MVRKLSVIAALVVIAAMAAASTASAAGPAKVKVTIHVGNGNFSGRAMSSKLDKCVKNRTVTLLRQDTSRQRPNSDTQIAMDTVELHGNHGEWSTGNTGLEGGRYYARIAAKNGCKAGSSPTIASDRPATDY